MIAMKMLWLLLSTLLLHQAVAMEPIAAMSEIIPATVDEKVQKINVVCPDGSQCPDGNTCCKSASGGYGCCPLPNAVCCSDGEHCCPEGYTCDVSAGTCTQQSETIQIFTNKLAIENTKVKVVQCNATSFCPDGNTCCRLASGQWGCCPLPNAVCCSDGEHCCPHGYTCSGSTCQQESRVTKLFKKNPAIQVEVVQCNATSFCPDANTCCRLASGEWGCCPLPNAVCCSDGEHCCPHGYTCSEGTCQQESRVTKLYKNNPAIQVKVVQCNATAYCPDGNTCCKLPSGEWGCCPSPNAVCCSDHEHCCPQGYTCTSSSCQRESHVTKLFKKNPAIQVKSVVCPGGTAQCPDGNTCCKLPSGQWGCCPLPNAVCCSDHEHCCPHGYTCDVSAETCKQQSESIQIFTNKLSIQNPKVKGVVCPGGQSECPDRNTCCKLSSGQWGCCPLPKAVCCSDGVHCCPHGYTCSGDQCLRESHVTRLFKKNPARQVVKPLKIK